MSSYTVWKGGARVKYVVLRETPPIRDCLFTARVVIWRSILSIMAAHWPSHHIGKLLSVCREEESYLCRYWQPGTLGGELYKLILALAKSPKHLQLSALSQVPPPLSGISGSHRHIICSRKFLFFKKRNLETPLLSSLVIGAINLTS